MQLCLTKMSLCGRHPPPPRPPRKADSPARPAGSGGPVPERRRSLRRGSAPPPPAPRQRTKPLQKETLSPGARRGSSPPLPLGAPTRARGRLAMGGERAARGLGCGQVQRSLRPPSAPAHPGPAPRPDPRPPTSEASICLSSLPMFASLISVTDHLCGHRLVINLFQEPLAFPSGPHWRDGTWHCHPSPAACGR